MGGVAGGFFGGLLKARHNHALLMVLCCAVPLVLILVLYWLGFSSYAFWLVLLLCPIMHLVMMKGMGKHRHEGQAESKSGADAKCH